MGFPIWTLWGMGLAAFGALLAIGLALIGQSPNFVRRLGLSSFRFDLRVRAFTGYAFALLLLAFGFFLAGVPLETVPGGVAAATTGTATPAPTTSPTAASNGATPDTVASPVVEEVETAVSTRSLTPVTGAFDIQPPTATRTPGGEETAAAPPSNTAAAGTAAATATRTPPPTPSQTPSATASSTATATPTATFTPTPTLTPTPISGQTAVVDTLSSTLWVRRTPGGSHLALVFNGDRLIVLSGHANQGGAVWQEVSTLEGEVGWVLLEYLRFEE